MLDGKSECEVRDIVEECDNTILHRAAGILRKAIEGISFQVDKYVPSSEKCKAFVPGVLLNFISWFTSKEYYQKAIGYTQLGKRPNLLKILAICHNIIALGCSTGTPMTRDGSRNFWWGGMN